jgi:hypothetical protein
MWLYTTHSSLLCIVRSPLFFLSLRLRDSFLSLLALCTLTLLACHVLSFLLYFESYCFCFFLYFSVSFFSSSSPCSCFSFILLIICFYFLPLLFFFLFMFHFMFSLLFLLFLYLWLLFLTMNTSVLSNLFIFSATMCLLVLIV